MPSASLSPILRSATSGSSASKGLTPLGGNLGFPPSFGATASSRTSEPVQLIAPAAPTPEAVRPPPQQQQPASLMIEDPVRSGQSVVFMDGDVTILGSVGSGAEIVAGGSIHVYGTL